MAENVNEGYLEALTITIAMYEKKLLECEDRELGDAYRDTLMRLKKDRSDMLRRMNDHEV